MLTLPTEEVDNLGVAQPTLLGLIHTGLSEAKRLDRARVDRAAFGKPAEEPGRLSVSLIQVRDDVKVGLDHQAATFDYLGRWCDLGSTKHRAAKCREPKAVNGGRARAQPRSLDEAKHPG